MTFRRRSRDVIKDGYPIIYVCGFLSWAVTQQKNVKTSAFFVKKITPHISASLSQTKILVYSADDDDCDIVHKKMIAQLIFLGRRYNSIIVCVRAGGDNLHARRVSLFFWGEGSGTWARHAVCGGLFAATPSPKSVLICSCKLAAFFIVTTVVGYCVGEVDPGQSTSLCLTRAHRTLICSYYYFCARSMMGVSLLSFFIFCGFALAPRRYFRRS